MKQKQEFVSFNSYYVVHIEARVLKNRTAIIWLTAAIYANNLTETRFKLKYWRPFLNT